MPARPRSGHNDPRFRALAGLVDHYGLDSPDEDIFREGNLERAPWAPADAFAPHVSLGEARRAVLVQSGFLEGLLRDPRVTERFGAWIDLLHDADDDLEFDVLELLSELGLHGVPWVAAAILEAFHRCVTLRSPDGLNPPSNEAFIHAAPIALHYEWRLGESLDEQEATLKALSEAARAKVADARAAVAVGIGPKVKGDGGAYLKTWGQLFYLRHVASPPHSFNRLSAMYCQAARHSNVDPEEHCRSTVTDAIHDAEWLLGLPGFGLLKGGPFLLWCPLSPGDSSPG